MGREIRRVPPNWEHPKNDDGEYKSMHDEEFDPALEAWLEGYRLWKAGEHPEQKDEYWRDRNYWDWDGPPPDPENYRPAFNAEPTWFQVYQTVSEGSPVTPPFATKEELVDYLVENGDFWDQKRGHGGWQRKIAEEFVKREWAPSMVAVASEAKATVYAPRDGLPPAGAH